MADIEEQMGTPDLLALNPVILPRDRGAILVRRLVAKRLAAEARSMHSGNDVMTTDRAITADNARSDRVMTE
jgi:hypothetical protein